MIKEIILKIIDDIWPMLVVFLVAICLMRFFYLKNHHERFNFHKEFCYLISILYLWILFEILTMAEINTTSGVNLVPFSEILRYEIGSTLFVYNVIGNILIFVPFGYLIGVYVRPKKIWPVLITTLSTSVVVEFVQLQTGRSFDIDDILLNVVGSILGYLLYIGLTAINNHLPAFLRSDAFYNIVCVVVIILFIIYVLGYWGVVFA